MAALTSVLPKRSMRPTDFFELMGEVEFGFGEGFQVAVGRFSQGQEKHRGV